MEIIDQLAKYVDIDKEISVFFDKNIRSKQLLKGEVFITQHSGNRNIYFVQHGLIRSFYYEDGKDITINFYPQETIFAKSDTILENIPTKQEFQALENSEVFYFNYDKIEKLCETSLAISKFTRNVMAIKMAYMQHRINSLQYLSAKEKYEKLLNENPDIILRAPLGMIASYLGISQETLSRIRGGI